jgi:hypothetical protein
MTWTNILQHDETAHDLVPVGEEENTPTRLPAEEYVLESATEATPVVETQEAVEMSDDEGGQMAMPRKSRSRKRKAAVEIVKEEPIEILDDDDEKPTSIKKELIDLAEEDSTSEREPKPKPTIPGTEEPSSYPQNVDKLEQRNAPEEIDENSAELELELRLASAHRKEAELHLRLHRSKKQRRG